MFSESNPYIRRLIRFFLLPYCYFSKIDWNECKCNPFKVCGDLLYIFFKLKYYPDNYGPCRLWEKPRKEWSYYFGSSYHPWIRHKLRKEIQPFKYLNLLCNKHLADYHLRPHDIPLPLCFGKISPHDYNNFESIISKIFKNTSINKLIIKPVSGRCGRNVNIITSEHHQYRIFNGTTYQSLSSFSLTEDFLIQEYIEQHNKISAIFPISLNTIRVVTFLTSVNFPIILGTYIRFGRGASIVDNVNQGGIAVGIDKHSGLLMKFAYNSKGMRFCNHPDTGFVFHQFKLPFWDDIVAVSKKTQLAVPFYRLIGLDIAIGERGPVVIEINANPDIIGLEQKTGPLYRDPLIYNEFKKYNLFINNYQINLYNSN